VSSRSPAALWRVSSELVLAIDDRFGSPVDGYVNGTQTWLTDDGPGETTLEWRLHPVGGYAPPLGVTPYDLWDEVIDGLRTGAAPDALVLGGHRRPLDSLWEGLECFPVYGAEVEPAVLAGAAGTALGMAPVAAGLVDHDRIGDEWERSERRASIVGMLADELGGVR
jgi:hypothetical protein